MALKSKIARVFADNFATYGVRQALGTDDAGVLAVARRTVERLMCEMGLRRGNQG